MAQEKKRGKCKNCFTKRRLSEKEQIEEERKNKAVKMVEDILTKKKNDDKEISKKEISFSTIKFLDKTGTTDSLGYVQFSGLCAGFYEIEAYHYENLISEQ